MFLVAQFGADADILEVDQNIINHIEHYQQSFFQWLYDESNKHPYWKEKGNRKVYIYRGDAFVAWLNQFQPSENKKAEMISVSTQEYPLDWPIIYF